MSPSCCHVRTVGLRGCQRWDRADPLFSLCRVPSHPSELSFHLSGASHKMHCLHNWAMSADFTVLVLRNQ